MARDFGESARDGGLEKISFAHGVATAVLSLSTEAARVDALLELRQ